MIYLPLLLVLPLVGGLLSLVIGRSRRSAAILVGIVFAGMFACVMTIITEAWSGEVIIHRIGNWPPGLGLGMAVDMFGSVMTLIITAIGALCMAFSFGEFGKETEISGFHSATFFLIAGLIGVVFATDLFNLFVFIELASVAACVLVAFLGGEEELEASLKYMILGTLSSFLFLAGIALAYDQVGSLNLGAIGEHVRTFGGNAAMEFSMVMVMIGIGMPAAIFPLHTWLPDAHSRAPSATSALLSGASVQVAVFAMLRVFQQSVGLDSLRVMQILPWAGLATALTGSLLALVQTDIKRLLAYTTIASGGFSLLILSMESMAGFQSLFLHLINHAAAKTLLFLSAGCLIHSLSVREFHRMNGAWDLMPGICLAFMIGCVADFGGPSLGFLSKAYMFLGLVEYSLFGFILAAVAVTMVAASYIRVLHSLFASREDDREVENLPGKMKMPVAILAIICVALGLLALPLLGCAETVARQILDGLGMIASMVGI